ncbi:hypothetical protein WSM22_10000 [Cytophagales bacterium WSM2-2]|nr:hypothetical protein WSM22_10000 [Cytophagales bacterium WSM2-2]
MAGNNTVTLIAKNDMPGCLGTKVLPGPAVIDIEAKFSVQGFFCAPPASVPVTNTSVGPGALTYSWEINGSQASNAVSPTFNFTALGTYSIKLDLNGDFNCKASSTKVVNIGTSQFEIVADHDVICEKGEVNFSVNSGEYLNPWTWDFGNGTTPAPFLEQTVKYPDPGTYDVKLTAAAGNCNISLTKKITVLPMPKPNFSTTYQCNRVVAFKNTSDNSVSWSWDLGDGTITDTKDPLHTYPAEGDYTIVLKAINAAGCAVIMDPVNIHIYANPVASILPGSQPDCEHPSLQGCAPLTITFKNNSGSNLTINKVDWNFGDGRTATSDSAKITYTIPGIYVVKLAVASAGGCTFKTQDTVRVYDPQQIQIPTISIDHAQACVGEEVKLKTSTPFNYPLCWSLENGILQSGNNLTYKYTNPGPRNIVLYVPGCPISRTFINAITVKEPKVDFQLQKVCVGNQNSVTYQVDFTNQSTAKPGLVYKWDFGDGTNFTDRDPPRHAFPVKPQESVDYKVSLNIKDPATGCDVTAETTINIHELKADFEVRGIPADNADPTLAIKACKNDEIQFTDKSLSAGLWQWNFDDKTSPPEEQYSTEQNPKKIYKKEGVYKVNLIVSDGVCAAIKTIVIPITVPDVDGRIGYTLNSDCQNLEVQFYDKSISVPPASKWRWDFGNGDQSVLQNPKYVYASKGAYKVSLTIGNDDGECTVPLKDGIVFTTPSADFTADPRNGCISETLLFNQTTQYTKSVRWDFGNGQTSNSFSPNTSYTQTGTYPVTLWAKDYLGCEMKFTKPNFINITKPTADFAYDKTIKDCPPLVTSFTNKSSDASKWLWDFGDGQKANALNPVNSFLYPGTYTVSLVATDVNGCTDQKIITNLIHVEGPTGVFINLNTLNCTNDTIRFSSKYSDVTSVQWDFGDGWIEQNRNEIVKHVYNTNGKVQPIVLLKDSKGCEVIYRTDQEMTVYLSPSAEINQTPQNPFEGEDVVFTTDHRGLDFSWNFGAGSIQEGDTASYAFDYGNQLVTLTMKDVSTGCITVTEKEIYIQGYPEKIPNVFTPNGDELNATFEVVGVEKSNWELVVFNRWGSQVYYSGDYKNEWTGGSLSPGVYYFKLRNKIRPEKHYTGDITLIR